MKHFFRDLSTAERLIRGTEYMVPVVAADGDCLPEDVSNAVTPFRLLGYPDNSFLGGILRSRCLPDINRRYTVETVCESAFTAGIKQMALAGMGVAWFPQGLVAQEIREGTLHPLRDTLKAPELTIALYVKRDNRPAEVDAIWHALKTHG